MSKNLKSAKASIAKQNIIGQVRTNAREVWLAGLGAFAAMQNEGGKVLSTTRGESIKVFNALVNQNEGGWNALDLHVTPTALQPIVLEGLAQDTQFQFPGAARPERKGSDFVSYLPSDGSVKFS